MLRSTLTTACGSATTSEPALQALRELASGCEGLVMAVVNDEGRRGARPALFTKLPEDTHELWLWKVVNEVRSSRGICCLRVCATAGVTYAAPAHVHKQRTWSKRMSNGPSRMKLNPLSPSSRCTLFTPTSNKMPCTPPLWPARCRDSR